MSPQGHSLDKIDVNLDLGYIVFFSFDYYKGGIKGLKSGGCHFGTLERFFYFIFFKHGVSAHFGPIFSLYENYKTAINGLLCSDLRFYITVRTIHFFWK